jgi:hypothetical protein
MLSTFTVQVKGVIVQVFAVPPTGRTDTISGNENYLGYFATEAQAGTAAPVRDFVLAAPSKLPDLIKRAGKAPFEVILVPVDRRGRPTDKPFKVNPDTGCR